MNGTDWTHGVEGRPNPAVAEQLRSAVPLRQFLQVPDRLTPPERLLMVEQALVLFEHNYVHLPLKRAMHAVDPVQRLKLLRYRLEEGETMRDLDFHQEMTRIFNSVRDLHTNYLLPDPYAKATAFLPFQLEEYWEDRVPRYLVSKVVQGFQHPTFCPGVEVLTWNGMPVRRAVEVNGDRQAGSNPAARFAKGLATLTTRPLVRSLPPDEEWVTVGYRAQSPSGPVDLEVRHTWMVFPPESQAPTIDPNRKTAEAAALGTDIQTEELSRARKVLFAPAAVAAEKTVKESLGVPQKPAEGALETTLPGVLKARPVPTRYGWVGHLRIFTFTVPDADAFVAEVVRLVAQLPQDGLIVDVRGNGGGLIYAGERLLQIFTPRRIDPERSQFLSTPLNGDICELNAEGELQLGAWAPSIEQSVETGSQYSNAFPMTDPATCNTVGQRYQGPVVLITDALCYSTTDIFTAGFQDHEIGKIIGVSANTGAGGANVWTHSLLTEAASTLRTSPYRPLPAGANMRVAMRRTLRAGKLAGTPVEDLGIRPDVQYRMSRRDLLEDNADLLDFAGAVLAGMPRHRLAARAWPLDGGALGVRAETRNVQRVDAFLDGRPAHSVDTADGLHDFAVALPPQGAAQLELQGYQGDQLVAAARIPLRPPA